MVHIIDDIYADKTYFKYSIEKSEYTISNSGFQLRLRSSELSTYEYYDLYHFFNEIPDKIIEFIKEYCDSSHHTSTYKIINNHELFAEYRE